VGVYAELDMKGNLFSSRNLMLQSIRANETKGHFYVAYLEFELAFLSKLMMRRNILKSGETEKKEKLDFIDEMNSDNDNE
jgi:hypothetical protein